LLAIERHEVLLTNENVLSDQEPLGWKMTLADEKSHQTTFKALRDARFFQVIVKLSWSEFLELVCLLRYVSP
jgi:hypothetical protein